MAIPAEDRLRALLREEVIPARARRLLACVWAEESCLMAGWKDARSLNAIAVARRFAIDEATEAELVEAASAAWSAAAAEAVSAARLALSAEAAWSAAVRGSLSAWAAWSAALAATRSDQLADVVRGLERIAEAGKAGKEPK